MMRYEFKGQNTTRTINWDVLVDGETAMVLYDALVDAKLISSDESPLDKYILDKHNLTPEDFMDDDEEYDYRKYREWVEGNVYLTDEEIFGIISEQNGMAYYQQINSYEISYEI